MSPFLMLFWRGVELGFAFGRFGLRTLQIRERPESVMKTSSVIWVSPLLLKALGIDITSRLVGQFARFDQDVFRFRYSSARCRNGAFNGWSSMGSMPSPFQC